MLSTQLLTSAKRRILVAALAVLGLAGDSGCDRDLPPLPLALSFRQEVPTECPSSACADYGLGCGAVVSLRVFPASASPTSSEPPIAESCLSIPAATDLCSLSGAGLELGELPAERVRIEVAMWTPDATGGTCPAGPMFDLAGMPLSTFDPQPAFAGSRTFDAGNEKLDVAEIPLSCYNADPLATCGQGHTQVTADIDDIDTLLFAPPIAAVNLRASIGVPKAQLGDDGKTVFVIDAEDDYELEVTRTVPVPQFGADVPTTFPEIACLQVLDSVPQSTTAVTCTHRQEPNDTLKIKGYLVPNDLVDQVLALVGEPSFPTTGIVIGRVVDAIGQPAAGATITATPPGGTSAEVLYINEDFTGTSTAGPTASHGYFVSRDAPFTSHWTANGEGDVTTGLIENKVTALVLTLSP